LNYSGHERKHGDRIENSTRFRRNVPGDFHLPYMPSALHCLLRTEWHDNAQYIIQNDGRNDVYRLLYSVAVFGGWHPLCSKLLT
jgi:hypothetical protein